MGDRVTATVKLTRFKGGTWSVAITYPDGSTEQRRGLVDDGHACEVLWNLVRRLEVIA